MFTLLAGLAWVVLLLQLPATLRRLAPDEHGSVDLHALDPMPVVDALVAAGINIGALGVDARLAEVRRRHARRRRDSTACCRGSTTIARR